MSNKDFQSLPASDKFLITTKPTEQGSLHKQARGYLKTASRLVGKDTSEQASLFEIPYFQTEINPYKETLSKMTAITGNLLLALWQANKDENGFYTIDNLTRVAEQINITPQELKLYLIYLGGYQYPMSKFDKKNKIVSIYHDKLFLIKFNIRLKDGETESSFNNDNRIGTNYLSFIRDREVYSVDVMPSISIQEELKGSGLGNVLVDDTFVAFSLGLSDLAYKIFCFSGSNKPHFKIGFDKLIKVKYLNLERQVKGVYNKEGKREKTGAGKTRVLKRIQDAFNELLEKGHIKKWKYDEQADSFSWTYSDKIIKHRDFLPKNGQIEAPRLEP